MDQSQLTPAQQAAMFLALKQAGAQPTTNMNEAAPTGAPDQSAQTGIDSAHAAFLQGTGHLPVDGSAPQATPTATPTPTPTATPTTAAPTAPVAPQQGFLSKFGNGVGNFLGMASGIKPMLAAGNVLENANKPDASLTNAWLTKFAATNPKPEILQAAKDWVAKHPIKKIQDAKTAEDLFAGSSTAKTKFTADQTAVLTNPDSKAADFAKVFPDGVPQEALSDHLKMKGMNQTDSHHNDTQWNKFTQAVAPGLVRGNTAVGIEARKMFAANHAKALFDQARTQDGGLDPRQQVEAAINVASMLMTNGVVTQQEVEKLLPNTIRGKVANWQEFFLNNPAGTEAQDFTKRLEDTVNRQATTSEANIKKGLGPVVVGYRHLRSSDPQRFDEEVLAAANQSYTINDQGKVVPIEQAQPAQAPAQAPTTAPVSTPTNKPATNAPLSTPRIRVKSVRFTGTH